MFLVDGEMVQLVELRQQVPGPKQPIDYVNNIEQYRTIYIFLKKSF